MISTINRGHGGGSGETSVEMCASAPASTGSTLLAAVNSEKSMTCLLFFISLAGIAPKFVATKVTIYDKYNALLTLRYIISA
jgi:hypothetical protein